MTEKIILTNHDEHVQAFRDIDNFLFLLTLVLRYTNCLITILPCRTLIKLSNYYQKTTSHRKQYSRLIGLSKDDPVPACEGETN